MYSRGFARHWIDAESVKFMIRGHECVDAGWAFMSSRDGTGVYTIFSASYYTGGDNSGAVLRFNSADSDPEVDVYKTSELRSEQEVTWLSLRV